MPLAAPVMTATFPASLCDDDRESAAVVEKRLAATPGKATGAPRVLPCLQP
jgi:hypothetical protein